MKDDNKLEKYEHDLRCLILNKYTTDQVQNYLRDIIQIGQPTEA